MSINQLNPKQLQPNREPASPLSNLLIWHGPMAVRVELLPSGLLNKELAGIFVDEFPNEFGQHSFLYTRKRYRIIGGRRQRFDEIRECTGDPWWWPAANGEQMEEWGLASDDPRRDRTVLDTLLTSLRAGVANFDSGTMRATAWLDFPGSLAAKSGCSVVLSTRPSVGGFPSPNCIKLYDVLSSIWPNSQFLRQVHVTDLCKFRGPTQDSDFEGMTDFMWRKSVRCLRREFDLLKPRAVLIVPGVERFFAKSSWNLLSSAVSATHTDVEEDAEIAKDVAFLRSLKSSECMQQVPYWAPGKPTGGDEQERIAAIWRSRLESLSVVP